MELFGSNIKKILIFYQKEAFLILLEIKKFLYFRKWNFLALLILKNSYIFSKENFSYISRNETLHFSAQDQKIIKSTQRKFLILQETKTPKETSYIFITRKLFLCFRKRKPQKKLFIFQEVTGKA